MKAKRDTTESSVSLARTGRNWLIASLCGCVLLQTGWNHLCAAQPEFSEWPELLAPPSNQVIPEAETPASSAAIAPSRGAGSPTNQTVAGSTNSMDVLDEKHQLAIGDRLSFRIVEDEEESKQLFVTDSGEVELPYIGRFAAAGRSCKELAHALKGELEKEYYYQATVIVAVDLMARSRGKVYLVGPVHLPGPQEIPSDELLTLSKAILRAGGFSDFADRKNVRVTRKAPGQSGEGQIFIVNVAEVLDKGRSEADLPLEPGDLVFIPERLIRF